MGYLLETENLSDAMQINKSYLKIAGDDFNRAAEYKMIEGAFLASGWSYQRTGLLYLLPYLHQRIWPRYLKYYHLKTKDSGQPKLKETDVLLELLLRGFVHINQARWDERRPYTVIAGIGDLVWKDTYQLHQEAIEKRDAVALPGYGSCPIPQDYDYKNRKFKKRSHHNRGFNI